jgi:hypothetical protein
MILNGNTRMEINRGITFWYLRTNGCSQNVDVSKAAITQAKISASLRSKWLH